MSRRVSCLTRVSSLETVFIKFPELQAAGLPVYHREIEAHLLRLSNV